MSYLHCRWIIALIIAYLLMMYTRAMAYDVSVSDLEWNYPRTLTPETGEIQYSYRFQLSPSSFPTDSTYTTQLYLSPDRVFSDDDFELFGSLDTLLPAGAVGFNSTVTRWFYTDTSLPATGAYYVFLEVTPALEAPTDTDSTNNTTMAPNPIRVENGMTPPPPPPSKKTLTAATVITTPPMGQSMIVAGYSNGVLEFRDWQGNLLAARDDLKEITAIASGTVGSPPLPRLFVASTDSGGTLRAMNLDNIHEDHISHTNLGRVTAVEVCCGLDGAVYTGTNDLGGTLRKLDALTLANEGVRGSLGRISDIIRMNTARDDTLAVGADKSGGSVYFIDMDSLDDVITRQQNLGQIYALSSADMNRNGHTELVIASDADGGSIQLREGPSFERALAIRTGLGQIYALDYGPFGTGLLAGSTDIAWILFASEPKGGSLNVMYADLSASIVKLHDWASRRDLGLIRYAELHDFFMVSTPLAGAMWQEPAGPILHVLDENLTGPATEPVTIEDFETGDFRTFPWELSGDPVWTVTSQEKHSGRYGAESGLIGHNTTTTLEVELLCSSGNITFFRKVSCEPDFDALTFSIDGVRQGRWSGEADWAEVSFDVAAGARIFAWTYSKDNSVSRGDDKAWIDDITFPIDSGSEAASSTIRSAVKPPCQIDNHYTFDK